MYDGATILGSWPREATSHSCDRGEGDETRELAMQKRTLSAVKPGRNSLIKFSKSISQEMPFKMDAHSKVLL